MPDTLMYPRLTLSGARRAADAALHKAEEIGMKAATVAVVDEGGHLLVLLREQASYPTLDIAAAKARTAASFGISSAQLAEQIQQLNPMHQADLAILGNLTTLAGGEPLLLERKRIGGIGVSGGSEEQDFLCAKAGAAALSDR